MSGVLVVFEPASRISQETACGRAGTRECAWGAG